MGFNQNCIQIDPNVGKKNIFCLSLLCCCWRDLLIPNYLSLGIIRGVNLAHHRQVGSLAAGLSRLSRRPNFYGLASSPQAKVAL